MEGGAQDLCKPHLLSGKDWLDLAFRSLHSIEILCCDSMFVKRNATDQNVLMWKDILNILLIEKKKQLVEHFVNLDKEGGIV